MRKLIVFFTAVFLLAGQLYAEDRFAGIFNGHDWVAWSPEEKNSFISGFVAGSNYVIWGNLEREGGQDDGGVEEKVLSKYLLEVARPEGAVFELQEVTVLRDLASKRAAENTNRNLVAFSIQSTSKVILSGLDEFYGQEKNRLIRVTDAIYVIKKKLSGATGAELEDLLSRLREGAHIDTRRLLVKSEEGHLFLP